MARKKGIDGQKVAALRAQGLTLRQIARVLGLDDHKSVMYHLKVRAPVCSACGARLTLPVIRRILVSRVGT